MIIKTAASADYSGDQSFTRAAYHDRGSDNMKVSITRWHYHQISDNEINAVG